MKQCRFFIVEDDPACRRMLVSIIEQSELGVVIGTEETGLGAVDSVLSSNPDIVILDLLLPAADGISIVADLRSRGFSQGIVMISQVEKKHMVAQAYKMGVEFYIIKPINKIEVLSVIGRILDIQKMRCSLRAVRESIQALELPGHFPDTIKKEPAGPRLCTLELLADMGISGEPGSYDLVRIAEYAWNHSQGQRTPEGLRLKDIFTAIRGSDVNRPKDIKATEQRIRRAVKQAMTNISALGLEDFQNPVFERYAHRFFDFNEIRRKMRELSGKQSRDSAKVDLRRFINALLIEISQHK